MDILGALGLVVILLLALNHMAGGRASNVLVPAFQVVGSLFAAIVAVTVSVLKVAGSALGSSLKLKGLSNKEANGRTPPRW